MSFSHWYNSISDAFKKRAGIFLDLEIYFYISYILDLLYVVKLYYIFKKGYFFLTIF